MASQETVIDNIVDHIQESYDLAMTEENIDTETREKIHETVGDAVGNNFETLAEELEALTE